MQEDLPIEEGAGREWTVDPSLGCAGEHCLPGSCPSSQGPWVTLGGF